MACCCGGIPCCTTSPTQLVVELTGATSFGSFQGGVDGECECFNRTYVFDLDSSSSQGVTEQQFTCNIANDPVTGRTWWYSLGFACSGTSSSRVDFTYGWTRVISGVTYAIGSYFLNGGFGVDSSCTLNRSSSSAFVYGSSVAIGLRRSCASAGTAYCTLQ